MTKHREPPDHAQVVALRRGGMKIGEICQRLGCSLHAANKALSAAGMVKRHRSHVVDWQEPSRAELARRCKQHLADLQQEQAHERV